MYMKVYASKVDPKFFDHASLPKEGDARYSDSYRVSSDIEYRRRIILMHDDVDLARARFEGVYTIKTTIINFSVVDGNISYYMSDKALLKNVYHGYLYVNYNDIAEENFKISSRLFEIGKFATSNAFGIIMGLWNPGTVDVKSNTFGLSFLNVFDLNQYYRNSTFGTHISVRPSSVNVFYDISFDGGQNVESVIPLPSPLFYSPEHAMLFKYMPVMTNSKPIKGAELLDSVTTCNIISVNGNTKSKDYRYDNDSSSSIDFYTDRDCKLKFDEFIDVDNLRKVVYLSSMCDDVLSKLFILFNGNMLRFITFVYDGEEDLINLSNMSFAFSDTPADLYRRVVRDVSEDSELLQSLTDIVGVYGYCNIHISMTDILFNIRINFKELGIISYAKFNRSIMDMIGNGIGFSTSHLQPITNLIRRF